MENDPIELPGRWQWAGPRTWPLFIAGTAVVAGFVMHVTINGLNYVALGAGAVAVLAAIVAIILGLVAKSGKQAAVAALFILLGGWHVAASGAISLSMLTGPSEDDVRQRIAQSERLTDVQVTRTGDGTFEYAGRRGVLQCRGTVGIDSSFGSSESSITSTTCTLPNSLPELEQGCRDGSKAACWAAMRRIQASSPTAWAAIQPLANRGCDLGHGGCCVSAGLIRERGHVGGSPDLAASLRLYQRACAESEATGCHNEALQRFNGRGIPEDPAAGARLWERACTLGLARSCEMLGECYRDGSGVAADPVRARQLFQQACDGQDDAGCINVAASIRRSDGPDGDSVRVVALYTLGCDYGGSAGCREAGEMLARGEGVPVDAPRGLALYVRGCDAGDAESCTESGLMLHGGEHGVVQDRPAALARFERGCELRDGLGCRNAAVYHRDGHAGERNRDRARELLTRACELGDQPACRDVRR